MHLCKMGGACHSSQSAQLEMCQAKKDNHACCQLPIEEDHAPEKEKPCTGGCYCCVPIIAQESELFSVFFQPKTVQHNTWKVSAYFYEFTDFIWHPPQPISRL